MIIFPKHSSPALRSGFSLPELLVIIVILGVIGAVGIQGFFFLVLRGRVQSVALEVAGWLEQVRNAAANEVTPVGTSGGCRVTFDTGSRAFNGQIAVVDTAGGACPLAETPLLVPPGIQQDSVTITPTGSPFTFTPRGLWVDGSNNPGTNFRVAIALNGATPVRCIRLSPTLGTVEIGRPPNSGSTDCSDAGATWEGL